MYAIKSSCSNLKTVIHPPCPPQVVAIVMDLLTDLHILQDLLDAAAKRAVAIYIVLDIRGAPHFLDMCNRMQVGPQHLRVSQKLSKELW